VAAEVFILADVSCDPGTGFATAAFGQVLSMAVSPRIIQFALKYNF
jgi:hypothetical protein